MSLARADQLLAAASQSPQQVRILGEPRLHIGAAVGDGAHQHHHVIGIGQDGVLAHAGPAKLISVDAGQIYGALRNGDGAEVQLGVKAHLLRLGLEGLRSQVVGKLGKVHVAGIPQGRGQILGSVGVTV